MFTRCTGSRTRGISAHPAMHTLQALYADSLVYGPDTYFTKVTLLLVIARVFNPFKATRTITFILIVGMVIYYLPVLILKARVCDPISGFWDSDIPAQCLDQRAIFIADTVMSAITDLAVLLLPLPATLSLRLAPRKKLKVWAMLGLGGVATVASFVRMFLVIQLQDSTDSSVDFVRFNLLGYVKLRVPPMLFCISLTSRLTWNRSGQALPKSVSG
jgi:hypothetical protein